MSIAHDAETRFPTTDGPSGTNSVDTATGDVTFSHAGAAGACGAVVVIACTGTTAVVSGVLYGGVAMTLSETATDTSEAGRIDIYTLVDGVPGGTQTVTLQGAAATGKWVTCSTVTSTNGSVRLAGTNHTNTTTSTNPTTTVTTDSTALLYGAVAGGAANPASYAVGSGYTVQFNNDYGALSARSQRRTSSVAAGSIAFNFTYGTSDDWCVAAVSLAEGAKISATVAGVGTLTTSGIFPGLTQWVETAPLATPGAQTGPSWSITPDGANNVGLVWTGAIKIAGVSVADLSGTTAGVGAATGTLGPPSGVPVNSAAPVLTGTGVEGQTLSLTSGSWSNSPTSFKYWWRRSDVPETIVENTSGSSPNTYVLTPADVGHSISGRVAATNATGTSYYTVASDTIPASGGVLPLPHLAGQSDGVGVVTAAITFPQFLSGTVAGVGAYALGNLASPGPLSGTTAGFGSATGTLNTGTPQVSGTVAGVGTASGTVITSAPLSGTGAGAGAAAGALSVVMVMSGSAAGSGAATGALAAQAQLTGTTAGVGSATGTPVTTPPGLTQWALTAPRTAGTQLGPSWSITPDGDNGGALVWVGAITGAAAYISGTAAGVGAAPATLSARTFLSGSANGSGVAVGGLAGVPRLVGTLAGIGAAPSALTTTAKIAAAAAGIGALAGTLSTVSGPALSGSADGMGALSGGPRATTLISGTVTGVGSAVGQPWVIPGLTQWTLTAPKATISAQTGPSWSASPDGPANIALVWSAAIRPVTLLPFLGGVMAGVGTASGNPTVPGVAALSGSMAGVGSASGGLTAPSPAWLTAFTRHSPGLLGISMAFDRAIVAGVGTVIGGLAAGAPALAGTAAGVGALAGALTAFPEFAGTLAGAGTLTGAPTVGRQISGTLAGVGSASGVLVVELTGQADGVGSASGSLRVAAAVAGVAAGVGGTSPSQVTTPGQPVLGGTAAGLGTLTATLKVGAALAGTSAGAGAIAGSLTAPAVLAGTVNGVGAVSGGPTATFMIAGTADGSGASTGTVSVFVQFGGSVNGTGQAIGSFTATSALTGTTLGAGAVAGNPTTPGVAAFVGTLNGAGAAIGSPSVPALGAITGTAAGSSSATATLGSLLALTGNLVGAGSINATISVPAVFIGTTYGTSMVTGHLRAHHRKKIVPAGVASRPVSGTGMITP